MGALYDRRMTVEEHCRETTGGRCGVRLEWTQLRTPAYVARFTLWVGVALGLWTVFPGCGLASRMSPSWHGWSLSGSASSGPICPRRDSGVSLAASY
jgi:hypothetical protein